MARDDFPLPCTQVRASLLITEWSPLLSLRTWPGIVTSFDNVPTSKWLGSFCFCTVCCYGLPWCREAWAKLFEETGRREDGEPPWKSTEAQDVSHTFLDPLVSFMRPPSKCTWWSAPRHCQVELKNHLTEPSLKPYERCVINNKSLFCLKPPEF